MRFPRSLQWFSLFAYIWVAVGLSEITLMTWLAIDHHEVSATVSESGDRQVILHHHKSEHLSTSYAITDTEPHADHVLDLPERADALVTAPVAKGVKAAKVWLGATPAVALTQIHTIFSHVTLRTPQPPPLSRNHTLSFFRTILLLI
ncbi:MAG: hypothetical protein WBJ03_07005 [Moraxellaceae bacterium]